MRDPNSFSELPAREAADEHEVLSWLASLSLPLSARISEKLIEILIAGEELRVELDGEAGAPLRWLAPELDRILAEAAAALREYAS
jgi:hypothetical protein